MFVVASSTSCGPVGVRMTTFWPPGRYWMWTSSCKSKNKNLTQSSHEFQVSSIINFRAILCLFVCFAFGICYRTCQLPREELEGAAVMALWSKALPLPAHCLSPLPGFESRPGHVRTRDSGFLHYFQLAIVTN